MPRAHLLGHRGSETKAVWLGHIHLQAGHKHTGLLVPGGRPLTEGCATNPDLRLRKRMARRSAGAWR